MTASLAGTTNLVHGLTVCVCDEHGEVAPGGHLGVYYRDVRIVSRLELRTDGASPSAIVSRRRGADRMQQVFVARSSVHGDPLALLLRRRTVGVTVEDRYELLAFAAPVEIELCIELASDFQPLRKGMQDGPPVAYRMKDGVLRAEAAGRLGVGVEIAVEGARPSQRNGELRWTARAAPGEPWETALQIRPRWRGSDDHEAAARPQPSPLRVSSALPRWEPSVRSASDDLQSLRVSVPELDLSYIAAGAPWFMALFGRDSLLTAHSSMIAGHDTALDVLEALARFQGSRNRPHRLEEPGRILHELRVGGAKHFGVHIGEPYYATVDAPALFVILLADAYRWGADPDRVAALLPNARAAIEWCLGPADRDGDGWIEY